MGSVWSRFFGSAIPGGSASASGNLPAGSRAQPFRQEVEEAAYGTPPRNPWVSAAYRKAKERAGQLLETLAAQVGEADRTHVDAVTVAWEAWMRAFFRHACYLGYRSGLFCLEQASLDQGLPEMMEQVIRTEYALGITLPQCQQELHREPECAIGRTRLGTVHRRRGAQAPGGRRIPSPGCPTL